MLPKITELEFVFPVEDVPKQGRSFLFDFEKGEFITKDGKMVPVEDIESLKVWIEKTIRTERFRFKIYDGSDYGVGIEGLIGSNYPLDFIKAEMKREVTEALIKHPLIESLTNMAIERDGSRGKISFQVNTVLGAFLQEVSV
jgi:hypothetical protein